MELLTGSRHLTPLDEHLPWLAKTNADIYALLALVLVLSLVLPFLMVPLAGVVAAVIFVKSRSRHTQVAAPNGSSMPRGYDDQIKGRE